MTAQRGVTYLTVEKQKFWTLSIETIFEQLKARDSGLNDQEAKKRLETYGLNSLKSKKKIVHWGFFYRSLKVQLL